RTVFSQVGTREFKFLVGCSIGSSKCEDLSGIFEGSNRSRKRMHPAARSKICCHLLQDFIRESCPLKVTRTRNNIARSGESSNFCKEGTYSLASVDADSNAGGVFDLLIKVFRQQSNEDLCLTRKRRITAIVKQLFARQTPRRRKSTKYRLRIRIAGIRVTR